MRKERLLWLTATKSEVVQKKLADLIEAIEKQEVGWLVNPKPIAEYLTEVPSGSATV